MQKRRATVILSVGAISLISILITVILTHTIPYSQNSNYNNVNVGSFRAPSGGHYSVAVAMPFQTYQDPIYGIKIQYPSNWEKIQLGKNFIVGFVSPSSHDSGVLENVMITATRLSSTNTSLNNFGNTKISALETQYQDFHLVSSGSFKSSTGSPLFKIEYTYRDGILPITTTEIWSLKGKEAFMLLANTDTSETSIYMPIFQKMINSFSSSAPATVLQSTKVHSV
ncbi:MAG: PsbP-related protein [Nitrososphaeraceae archaeon]